MASVFDSFRRDIEIGGQTFQYYALNELDPIRYGMNSIYFDHLFI